MIIPRNCDYWLAQHSVAPCGHHCKMVNRNGREFPDGTEPTYPIARHYSATRYSAGCAEIL
jgi:hypothetical protein